MTTAGAADDVRARYIRSALPILAPAVAVSTAVASAFVFSSAAGKLGPAGDAAAPVAAAMCVGVVLVDYWLPSGEHPRRVWGLFVAWAAAWFVCALVSLLAEGAQIVGVAVSRLTVGEVGELLHSTNLGQWGLVGVVCPLVLTVIGSDAMRGGTGWHPALVLGVAALGIIASPLTGHLSLTTAGALVISAHAVAAAVWMGPLLAATSLLSSSAAWSGVLRRYSRVAWWSAWTVAASGAMAGVVRMTTAEVTRSYLVLFGLKIAVLVVLFACGARARRVWVGRPDTSSRTSVRRATTEFAVMAVAVGIAATLSSTP
ncbi:CopD family protein [Gordonia sp. 'Campus']|uniref:CopD family protein n=1 Tax=Gordonia sp. 'Campus' TaxID=2915824 RepID=UPI001EE4CEBF|nr:CopD family protein [Gordonia sp. 'Campus']